MALDDSFAFKSIKEIQNLYKEKQLSPVEMTELYIDRIQKLNGKLNAYLTYSFEHAIDKAKLAEKEIQSGNNKGLLHGIPVAVKDLELTKGIRTTSGSLIYKNRIPDSDSIVVERLKANNAIILGKTNTPEFGLLGETKNLLGDHCRNPWNIEKTSGGSSGGSGAAVVAGMCSVATGSDGGGSIRIPASFTGVYGIKPTQGRIPRPGLNPPLSSHTAQAGPMSRSIMDSAILFQVMAGYDSRDIFSLTETIPNFTAAAESGSKNGISGMKVGWTPDYGYAKVDPEVLSICEKAANAFQSLGCSVSLSDFSIDDPFLPWLTLFGTSSLSSNLEFWPNRADEMADYTQETYKLASNFSAADFSRGVGNIQTIRTELDKEFEKFDILLSPTMAVPPYDCGQPPREINDHKLDGSWGCLPFTYPINSAGYPAASIPAGMTDNGLPVGLHVIGKFGDEETIIKASAAFESAHPWSDLRPQIC